MKSLIGLIAILMMCLLVTSLFQASQATPSPVFSPGIRPTSVQPTRTLAPNPSITPNAVMLPPWETPLPTFLPTIEATLISGQLSAAFSIQTQEGIAGHDLVRITGWRYGFRPSRYCFGPYQWMDQDHLFLFPLTGQEDGMGTVQLSLPVVINYKSGKTWIPSVYNLFRLSECQQPLWSEALNVLISTRGSETIVYTPEGDIVNRYPGTSASLSPSGTKLIAGGVWIDLLTGKQVDFSSKGINYFSTWSSDENELYGCCYAYGNARTGEAFTFELDGLRYVGRDYGAGFRGIKNLWVMNDTYVVTYWDFYTDDEQGILPLIEPSKQTYKNLQDITDVPDDTACMLGSVAPDKKQIWANCNKPNSYLVDLETLAVEPYPSDLHLISWSPKNDFALMKTFGDDSSTLILSIADKKLTELSGHTNNEVMPWHPSDSVLAYLSEDQDRLILIDAQAMARQERTLPATFHALTWNHSGGHIAMVAEDGSLWQVDYPGLETVEQLTPSLPDVRDLTWSPENDYLAFVSDSDIYIVHADR